MSSPVDIYIALGGNEHDVLAAFRSALDELPHHGISVIRVSSAFRTQALMPPAATERGPDYWNAACHARTELGPRAVLRVLLQLESDAGRERRDTWENRPLDLDLLLYGDQLVEDSDLVVPHPHLAERTFVLQPLVEIAAEVTVPPGGDSVGTLLGQLADPMGGIEYRLSGWR